MICPIRLQPSLSALLAIAFVATAAHARASEAASPNGVAATTLPVRAAPVVHAQADARTHGASRTTAAEPMTVLGQTGGFAGVAATDGRLVVLGVGPRLFVLDLLFPDEPLVVGQTELLGGVVTDAVMADGRAYLAAGMGGLVVVDLTDPTTPDVVGHLDTRDHVHGVAVEGERAYLLNAFAELIVVDVSDPTNPGRLGTASIDGGIPAAVASAPGNVMVTAREDPWTNGELRVFDTSDPSRPTEISMLPTGGSASDVSFADGFAFVANGDAGLLVVDVSDPLSPRAAGALPAEWVSDSVRLFGDIAYVADFAFGLQIVDISAPETPRQLGWLDLPTGAEDVAVFEGYAYVADGSGLQIGDVSDATQPVVVGAVDAEVPVLAEAVAVSGTTAFVGDDFRGMSVVSVVDLRHPYQLGRLPLDLPAADIAVDGTTVFLASGSTTFDAPPDGRVTVASVADPASPQPLTEITTGGSASGVAAADGWLYIADGAALRVFDVSDPTQPRETGSLGVPDVSFDKLALDDTRGLVIAAGGAAGLVVVDVSDPSDLLLVATAPTADEARAVAVSGELAYVAAGTAGLFIFDVSNPASPREIGSLDSPRYAQGVDVEGDRAFVADGGDVLSIDVSDPTTPVLLGSVALADDARDVAIRGGVAFVAAEAAGLYAVGGAGQSQAVWLPVALRRHTLE